MNALFSMPGGKAFQKKLIVPKFPAHEVYIEPFVGGGSIFFYKEPSAKEIINDKDESIASFYRYIQTHPTPPRFPFEYCTQQQFIKLRDSDTTDEHEKFVRTFIVQQMSFRANRKTFAHYLSKRGTRPTNFKANKFLQNYAAYHQRLQGVTILNKDYREVISEYDAENAFIYLDPPYETGEAHDVTNANNHGDWYGTVKLEEIEETVRNIKGMWMLSFSNNPRLVEKLKDFNIEVYETCKSGIKTAA